jgi:hypothetical protein
MMEKDGTSFDGAAPITHIVDQHEVTRQSMHYAGYCHDAWTYPQASDAFHPAANFPFWQG